MRNESIGKAKKLDKYRELDPNLIDTNLPNDILKEYSKKHGVTIFDLTEPMRRVAIVNGKAFYIQRDTHWNVEGNRLAAEIEADFLIKFMSTRLKSKKLLKMKKALLP